MRMLLRMRALVDKRRCAMRIPSRQRFVTGILTRKSRVPRRAPPLNVGGELRLKMSFSYQAHLIESERCYRALVFIITEESVPLMEHASIFVRGGNY